MIGYISDNLLIPILDFFYGLVPSYGLAIVALTIVIRLALFPLSAGSIRSARRMKIAQPVMQKRQAEIKSRYASNPQKQQEELGKLMGEFGSPLAGCLPLIVQMPILFALFATLRGSPFADVPYLVNIKVLPSDQIAAVEPKPFKTAKHSIFITEKNHFPVIAALPGGTKIGSGDSVKINLQTMNGDSYVNELQKYENGSKFSPSWKVTKGEDIVKVSSDGTVNALNPGDATVEAKIPGLAAKSGFLFIKALGNVGFYVDGAIHWDIAILVAGFGLTLVISQVLSGRGMPVNKQQSTANKITPVMITGMFLFFPLPAGVLLYMVIANIFQGLQTFLLSRESLPDNLQKILDDQLNQQDKSTVSIASEVISDSDRLPFEPKSNK
ncbi:MAG: membrane protein insertase YidC [Prochlorococcus sp. MED-G73]|uniref:Inner membrane protein translocase component YidC n=1 Tax=Prochlorococcus marinus str. PAC1 TaxID=59924 RepID=A0A0A2C7B8_PROMR|nr:membrane protein insertase YidC [Prochlorococcus marinus]KGG20785.1 Inner membrane protein translocase component YidC [Prochlorococcus marinus str. PAC1]MAJ25781.1 membrane protein insertase YidC [Prochlorococcus sp. MED630]RCL48556.1 MAG: membrane protein insertase YidC [Prochlorococcus sp. MED-G73]